MCAVDRQRGCECGCEGDVRGGVTALLMGFITKRTGRRVAPKIVGADVWEERTHRSIHYGFLNRTG
jgi:hypothetical protein